MNIYTILCAKRNKLLERSLRETQRMERSGTPQSPVSGAGPGGSESAGNAPKIPKCKIAVEPPPGTPPAVNKLRIWYLRMKERGRRKTRERGQKGLVMGKIGTSHDVHGAPPS
jgi:hypothetical protein